MIRRKVLAGLAMLLALGCGGVAFAVSTEDSTEPQIRTFAAGAARDMAQSEAQLAERGFSVWRRAARATDVPGTDVLGVEAIERGANAGQSRRLSNTYSTAIYATPVNGGDLPQQRRLRRVDMSPDGHNIEDEWFKPVV